jgi:hypothetical protein
MLRGELTAARAHEWPNTGSAERPWRTGRLSVRPLQLLLMSEQPLFYPPFDRVREFATVSLNKPDGELVLGFSLLGGPESSQQPPHQSRARRWRFRAIFAAMRRSNGNASRQQDWRNHSGTSCALVAPGVSSAEFLS